MGSIVNDTNIINIKLKIGKLKEEGTVVRDKRAVRMVRERKHNRECFQLGGRKYLMNYVELRNYRFLVTHIELSYHNYTAS